MNRRVKGEQRVAANRLVTPPPSSAKKRQQAFKNNSAHILLHLQKKDNRLLKMTGVVIDIVFQFIVKRAENRMETKMKVMRVNDLSEGKGKRGAGHVQVVLKAQSA